MAQAGDSATRLPCATPVPCSEPRDTAPGCSCRAGTAGMWHKKSLFPGADAIAEQLWPSDRKSGRWSLPCAVIYGMLPWKWAGVAPSGFLCSVQTMPSGKGIPAVHPPGILVRAAFPWGRRGHPRGSRAVPVLRVLLSPPPCCPMPCHGPLLLRTAQGCIHLGGAGFPSAGIFLGGSLREQEGAAGGCGRL